MTNSTATPVLLFSYGTLQDKAVQLSNFGRELAGNADRMLGYGQSWVEISDPQVLATSGNPEDSVSGMVFQITAEELAAADAYEVSDYKRVSVRLASGLDAWVYVSV